MKRFMDRLKSPFKYRLYTGMSNGVNSDGLFTGEQHPTYSSIMESKADIGFALGKVKHLALGLQLDYDKTMLLEQDLGIDEHSQLWIDDLTSTEPDYVVKRVLKSQTGIIRIEVSKVMH